MGRVMEVQFNRTSAGGSVFTGPITIIGMAVGLLTSGYVITKYKPPPKYLFFWNVVIGLITMCASFSYTQLGCESNNSLLVNGTIISCNSNCMCDGISYSPVCDRSTDITYFSPCHAGCKTYDEAKKIYKDCSCNYGTPFITKEIQMERSTNQAILNGETKPTEKRITLEDVYDEELKPNKQPHDDDVPIDVNDDYDDDDGDYDDDGEKKYLRHIHDSAETEDALNTQKLAKIESNKQFQHAHVTPGACIGDCTFDYYTFSLISMCSSLISSTGRIGNVLLNFR